jgi:hypothetical protein
MDLITSNKETSMPNTEDEHRSSPQATKEDLVEFLLFDQIDDRKSNIKRNYTKTCAWLLQDPVYQDWLSAEKYYEHHGFFWIKGKPGSGKSTLTKFVLTYAQETVSNAILLSFFFNARGTDLERSTIGLYRSLLVRLLEAGADPDCLLRTIRFKRWPWDEDIRSDADILKRLLRQLFGSLHARNIMLIIDALDECPEVEIRDMIAFFEQLGDDAISRGVEFRVLLSSRYYPNITVERLVQLRLDEQSGHEGDIERYISGKLNMKTGKQVESIRREICERSSGIFMWVVLVVDILNQAFDRGHIHALQKKLKEIPSDLSTLFKDILTRDQENMDEMLLCIQWILYANRPLRREELYFAILSGSDLDHNNTRWDPDEISLDDMSKFILSSSKGLVEVTKSKDHTLQFIHESVKDFLLKEDGLGQIWRELRTNTAAISHDRLRQCCCHYTSNVAGQLQCPQDLPAASSGKSVELRANVRSKFLFLDYATQNVLAHADMAQMEGIDQTSFLKGFELRTWVHINNILERYQVRRFPLDIGGVNVLAAQNRSHLIRPAIQTGWGKDAKGGRYDSPIEAAMANLSYQALDVLITQDLETHPHGCAFPHSNKNFFAAVIKVHPKMIHYFLSVYDLDSTWTARDGQTLLSWSAEQGHDKIVELLLSKGANVNVQRGGTYGSALQAASAMGHNKIVELLLSEGADVNAQGGYHGSVLRAASLTGRNKIVELLLSQGADVNMQSGGYGSALQAASERGHIKIVELLLSQGADVNMQGGGYGRALQAASARGHNKTVELLLSEGADINAQGGYHGSALQAASEGGHNKIVELLLSQGADINAQGGYHGSALQAASTEGHKKIVELLLSKGANR